jgi:diguanylate cyclase (GGDEF)-like protein
MVHLKSEDCLNFFSEVLNIIKSTHEPERVLSLIVDRIVRIYDCQTCAVIIIDPESEYLRVLNNHNLSYQFVKEFRHPIGTGAIARMLSTGTPICIEDADKELEIAVEIRLEHAFHSAVCLQIVAEHRTLGYLYADAREINAFARQDLRTLQSFADLSSIALNKSYLYEKNLRLDPVDPETGLEKYAPFLERLNADLTHSKESHKHLSVFILDIDNYKQIGGTYGFDASKRLLREIAETIKSRLGSTGTVGRYGFDEMIILRQNCSLEQGIRFAEELRQIIEKKEFTQKKIRTTISIGAAAFSENAESDKELLFAAKEALYNAQHKGRNRVEHP